MKQLILGGVRSGKSRYAEQWATRRGAPVTYIATALPADDEMRARITEHRRLRPQHWRTVEAPIDLVTALHREAQHERCVVVDCLTLWLTQVLCEKGERVAKNECDALVSAVEKISGAIVLVSNEVGLGIVPMGELSRQFCDCAGRLHQGLAQVCDGVTLMVAGLPVLVKGERK
jgi:adenosylcobinamide kinase/adenosylcobinamide-phosphate guanylyltransferase